jgi:hypothetical protein
VQSVNQELCHVACGTCYNPIATISYMWKNKIVYSVQTTHCNRNDEQCLNNFISNHELIGKTYIGYVNPENPKNLITDISYDGFYIAFLVLSSFDIFTVCLFVTYLSIHQYRNCKNCKNNNPI